MDIGILYSIQHYLQCPFCDVLFKGFTFLGDKGLIWIIVTALLLAKKETRYAGIVMGISVALSAGLVQFGLKPLFNRTRPYLAYNFPILIPAPMGTSFPSGHAATSFAAAWSYFCLYKNKLRWGLLIIALGIAFSRLYLFVHYPSDVVVGVIVGLLVAYMARWLADWIIHHFHLESAIPPISGT
ncbi:phosphatase PAP2 family protein [Eubacterium barkeri]|uniref:Undecaprenyl-diphosphatase n=1 Tax=Eubacterium barkeri TaxID=1528 RepID=A0A1H3JP08_EUBBA|nr:phosphatase PAP2 family protein [Eubacterium barkeri]SDY41617.1 undecaprenyl-diphosphatase [Eubacterium barkeri]